MTDEPFGVAGENKTSEVERLKFTVGVRAIFQDRREDYWFESHGEGLCRYDGEIFEYFTTKDGLADDQILTIQEDAHGRIWVDTLRGVSRYAGDTFLSFPETQRIPSEFKLTFALPDTLQESWRKAEGDLWFSAGTREGVFRLEPQQFRYLPFPHPKTPLTGNTHAVTGFSAGKSNVLWTSTYADVFGHNGDNLTIINDEAIGFSDHDDRIHVRCVLEDSQGRLWIGSNGIGVLLKEGESIVRFSKEHGKLMPMEAFESTTLAKAILCEYGTPSCFCSCRRPRRQYLV